MYGGGEGKNIRNHVIFLFYFINSCKKRISNTSHNHLLGLKLLLCFNLISGENIVGTLTLP